MEEEKQFYTIILRHDTSTQWMVNNPILALGEYGVEDDTHKVKRGDGESNWEDLVYEDFGLQYIVTFANLSGEITDNEALTQMFGSKLSVNVFEDVNGSVVSDIGVLDDSAEEDEYIARIQKTNKNINSGATVSTNMIIKSEDNTVQGYWSVDERGVRTLNVIAVCSITDYKPRHRYYKDQLCYFNNKLYRAYRDIDADKTFNEGQWVLLASLHASDIKYDNLVSGLDAENVKDALDELKRRDDRKVQKSTEERVVYGTTATGEQTVIPIDDLRKVDTVNHKQADLNKNVQLDASEIKYSDANPELGSIRKVLDSKVDKNFAGEDAKIVRDVRFEYVEETGKITLIEDKVSPATGDEAEEVREINVVSEQEMAHEVATLNNTINEKETALNNRITDEVTTLNNRVTNEVNTLNTRVDTEVNTLNTRIDSEVNTLETTIETTRATLDTKIDTTKAELQSNIDTVNTTLNTKIDTTKTELNDKIDDVNLTLDTKINTTKTELDNRIDEEVATLNQTIVEKEEAMSDRVDALTETVDANKLDIENKLEETRRTLKQNIDINDNEINSRVTREVDTLNNRIDEEVNTLNDTITTEKEAINGRVDQEVATLNETINAKETALKQNIDDNKADIETKLAEGLDLKIDKDIADNILTDISASQQSQEPTLKLVRKNTRSKEALVNHIHFKAIGNIETRLGDGDHIEIDSTMIDDLLIDHTTRLNNVDQVLTAHGTDIAALYQHDVNHEKALAEHTEQIAILETEVAGQNDRLDTMDNTITDIKAVNANQEVHLVRVDEQLDTHTRQLQDQADLITGVANQVSTNKGNIERLQEEKVDKAITEKVVDSLKHASISGNELMNIEGRYVNLSNGEATFTNMKLISSDNTVVATMIDDNTIDIATNLDIDVHYFVTSETLNTAIPSTNTIALDSLTATTKDPIEVNDIITDSEGTWARCQAIDTEAGTITCVTFHDHKEAVWGAIGGDITAQQDLQAALATKVNISSIFFDNKGFVREVYVQPHADKENTFIMGTPKILDTEQTKVTDYTQIDSNDNSISLTGSLGNLHLAVDSENASFDSKESGLTSIKLADAIRELKALSDEKLLITSFNEYTFQAGQEGIEQNRRLDAIEENINTTIPNAMETKLDKVSEADKVYGTDANGEQTTYDKNEFGKVNTVNGIEADENKNITLTGEDIKYKAGNNNTIAEGLAGITGVLRDMQKDMRTQFTMYSVDTEYTTGRYVAQKFVTFVREDGIQLMARILKPFTSDNTHATNYECFAYDIEIGNLQLIGIPEQQGGDTPTPTVPYTGDTLDSVETLDSGVQVAVSHNQATGETGVKYLDFTNTTAVSQTFTSTTWEMTNNIVEPGQTITAINNDSTLVSSEIDKSYITSNFNVETTEAYGTAVMNTLNEVDGVEDTYEELGGTESEISAILDDILGN